MRIYRPILIIIVIIEFELHKRLEEWNAFDKSTVRWSDRKFEQGRTILFNVVVEAKVGEIFSLTRLDSKVLKRRSYKGGKKGVVCKDGPYNVFGVA